MSYMHLPLETAEIRGADRFSNQEFAAQWSAVNEAGATLYCLCAGQNGASEGRPEGSKGIGQEGENVGGNDGLDLPPDGVTSGQMSDQWREWIDNTPAVYALSHAATQHLASRMVADMGAMLRAGIRALLTARQRGQNTDVAAQTLTLEYEMALQAIGIILEGAPRDLVDESAILDIT